MPSIVICEKASQAADIRKAIGNAHGQVLPCQGHLLKLKEPGEVNPAWERWNFDVLWPGQLYPSVPDSSSGKGRALGAIKDAIKGADTVVIATDCDREGQLIGEEVVRHFKFKGKVMRAMFVAQDPKTLQDAFRGLRPNSEYRALGDAAIARQQADQVFNLSLTRVGTLSLRAPGTKGVIGIGRVKTPTLAIACIRELEILNFKPTTYFEVAATANVAAGSFEMLHERKPEDRIMDTRLAQRIAQAAEGHRGPLAVKTETKRRSPPRLFDITAVQKLCGRWGWGADRASEVLQRLYEEHKLITYPRAEVVYLKETQIEEAAPIVNGLSGIEGLGELAGRAIPVEGGRPKLTIRKGKDGHFYDKGLEGFSHHAIIPNVNVMDRAAQLYQGLDDSERRLFDEIAKTYLAAMAPDYVYEQTTATMGVPVPGEPGPVEFRAIGQVPKQLGWKVVFGAVAEDEEEPDEKPGKGRGRAPKRKAMPVLPAIRNGETAELTDAKVVECVTQPPHRFSEGDLATAMKEAWRFVEDDAIRARLKECTGIGTPATRSTVIEGLKKQQLLVNKGKHIVPTQEGMNLYQTLKTSAADLVDPGVTAKFEMVLDAVLSGQVPLDKAIATVVSQTGRLAEQLKGAGVRQHGEGILKAGSGGAGGGRSGPTDAMLKAIEAICARKGIEAPKEAMTDFDQARAFLNEHPREGGGGPSKGGFKNGPSGRPSGPVEGTVLNVSYDDREEAKRLGARWDPENKVWKAPKGADLQVFVAKGFLASKPNMGGPGARA